MRNEQEGANINIKLFYYIVLAEQSKGKLLIATFIIVGFLRGATLVNFNLCISECCTLKKLPSAFGMFMVIKGLFVVAISPLIGMLTIQFKIIFLTCVY